MEFFHTHVSSLAISEVTKALTEGRLSEGERVLEFERQLGDRLGLKNPVALNSGTSALHLAMILAGVGTGDEVILPAQTFIASGLSILMQGGIPVFADIDPSTGNISPASVERKITSKTKAILAVHWGGSPCELDKLHEVAKSKGAVLIEDAAHALGATFRGTPIGAISPLTVFSFQAIKHVTTGDGGALCSLDANLAHKARVKRWFGIDRKQTIPSPLGERVYDLNEVGFKYHMNDVSAAIGLGNLSDFPARLHRRREINALYRQGLKGISGLELLREEGDRKSACWLFTVLVERREQFISRLKEAGIPTSCVHLRIDRNSIFGGLREDLIGQEEFNQRQVSVPLHEGLSDLDVQRVISTIRGGW